MKLFTLALFCLSLATTTYAQSELSSSESTAICKDIIRQLKFDEGSSLSLCLRGKWSTKKAAANSTATEFIWVGKASSVQKDQATCKGLYVRATAPYSSYFNNTCSSKDSITGHVLLNKKEMSLNAQININTAKKVTLGSESYNINRLNAGQLSASLGQKSIEIYYNDLFDENDFTNANKAEIIKYFNLKNGQELKCKKGLSKAFLVLTNEKGENIGNCVN
jgi:hypothetical protein